jgi:ribosomal-protein-alanine N-acetyltransferase
MRADEEMMRYVPLPLMESVQRAKEVIGRINMLAENGLGISWGVYMKGQERLIGTINFVQFKKQDFRAEIGYMLHKDFGGKGLMQEGFSAVLDFGFDVLKLHSVEAVVHPENRASLALLKRNGFVQEAYFKDYLFTRGSFIDSVVYSLIR